MWERASARVTAWASSMGFPFGGMGTTNHRAAGGGIVRGELFKLWTTRWGGRPEKALRRRADLLLDAPPGGDVVEHEVGEVGVAVADLDLAAGLAEGFAGPGGLSRGPVTVE